MVSGTLCVADWTPSVALTITVRGNVVTLPVGTSARGATGRVRWRMPVDGAVATTDLMLGRG